MTLGKIILQYREEHSLSQRQFAARCGITSGYISMLEKNKNPSTGKPLIVGLETLRGIAQAMNMTADELIRITDGNTPVSLELKDKNVELTEKQDASSVITEAIGTHIRTIRKKMNMSQQELARRSGVRQAVISEIETSAKLPALDNLIALAHALGVEPSDLMGEKFCPVCGFEYSYDEGLNSAAHQRIHARAEAWAEKYGFFWPYRDRKIEYTAAYSVMNDADESIPSRFSAAVRLIRCLFCRSVSAYAGDDHPGFDAYAAMLLGSDYAAQFPQAVRGKLLEKFGQAESMLTGTYYQRGPVDAGPDGIHPRLHAILDKMKTLPDAYIDIIEYICSRSSLPSD